MILPPIKFSLGEFKALGRWLDKSLPPLFAWIVKAFAKGLERRYIHAKVQSSVEVAIARYRASEEPLRADPVVTETPSEVEGLPNISIKAPWTQKH